MSYTDELAATLEAAKEVLEKELLGNLRAEYSLQATAVHGMLDLLIKKRIIHGDLYAYDDNVTDIELPETAAFPANEKSSVIGERFSHYAHTLDFIVNHFQFTCHYLSPKKVLTLKNLTEVFVWEDFREQSSSPNTAALATLINKSGTTTDKITVDILRNSVEQLSASIKKIKPILSKLALYHRAGYKLFIRKTVLPVVPAKERETGKTVDDIFRAVKKTFAQHFSKKPFYQDLVLEVINEDFTPEGESLQAKTIASLNFASGTGKKEAEKVDKKQFLLSGLRILASSGSQFALALEKIVFNENLINKENRGFFSKLMDVLRKVFNIKAAEKEITVSINDPITQSRKKECINLHTFKLAVENKIKIFNNIVNSSSEVNARLQQIPEDTLYENFSRYLSECNELLDQLAGLDQYYRTVKPSVREKIKGVRPEITTIRNSIINANQYRAEYMSRSEAEKQTKKLGLDTQT